MKIVYAGSPQYAVKPLEALINSGKDVVAVITQPDRPVGRKRVLTPTPVKEFALNAGIPVIDCERLKEHTDELAKLGAELMITCAYGQILTEKILNIFPMGVYNLHASLLPKFRGASPIQSAILAGEEYTGVTVMKTERTLDSGAILLVKRIKIDGDTYGELSEKLSYLSALAAIEAVTLLEAGEPQLLLQDEAAATFCKKLSKEMARVDFSHDSKKVSDFINAYSPSPAAYAMLNGNAVNLLKAVPCQESGEVGTVIKADKTGIVIACGEGAVSVLSLQFSGGKILTAADAVNGRKIYKGDKLD